MNFTYFKFLFINTIRRKPVWITWLLFLFTCTCFIIILPLAAKMNTLQVWANTTMAVCETFLGMTAAIFTAVLAINIFKDTNEEGTELIIVSKPITRFKVVITKFILFGCFCLAVNLSACIITCFTIFLPRTEQKFYWGLIISMFIGNLITFGVFGSIAILMSVRFAKVGIIITNIALSLVFLIYQALTIFVFRTPSRALIDNRMAAPSYITHNRNTETGEYTEDEFVNFVGTPVEKKDHFCTATNWKEMKDFWFDNIMGVDPTVALNITDLAGQISLTYLSVDLGDFALRQTTRMFAISRFYKYDLYSPASPELIGDIPNKKSLPWLYTGKETYTFETLLGQDIDISIPSAIGYFGIKPTDVTRLRGFIDKIPVGFVQSKELLSQKEVYFEPEQWQKYKKPFDILYDNIFNWDQYVDCFAPGDLPEDLSEFASLFNDNTDAENRFYGLLWNSLSGGDKSLLKDETGKLIYDKTSFDITSIEDLNERFLQFKYYAYYRVLKEQQDLLHNTPTDADVLASQTKAKEDLDGIAELLGIGYHKGWMMKNITGDYDYAIIEPNTETVSYNLIDTAYEHEYEDVIEGMSDVTAQRNKAVASPKGVMDRTQAIFNSIIYPPERFLFDSLEKPTRNAKYSGQIHTIQDAWIPYPATLIAPFYLPDMPGYPKLSSVPMGHNMSIFFYNTKPVLKYWYFAVVWGTISVALMTCGVVVYNKYDVR